MKLVITYSSGDGYTYACTQDQAVEAESVEHLYCELLDAAIADDRLTFENYGLDIDDIRYDDMGEGIKLACDIRTLEDWFEETKA